MCLCIWLIMFIHTQLINNWASSPILVVDNHIHKFVQCSGEFRWIWGQFLGWGTSSLPFHLFTSFLPSLELFLSMMITFTFLQTDVLFHLHQGTVLAGFRLQEEGRMSGDILETHGRKVSGWNMFFCCCLCSYFCNTRTKTTVERRIMFCYTAWRLQGQKPEALSQQPIE